MHQQGSISSSNKMGQELNLVNGEWVGMSYKPGYQNSGCLQIVDESGFLSYL